MAILQKLKSLLGFDESDSERGETREVGVTRERTREEGDDGTAGSAPEEESAAAGTSASGSTGSMTEPADGPEEAAEPAEATGPSETDGAPTEPKTPDDGGATAEPADDVETAEPSDVIEDAEAADVEEDASDLDASTDEEDEADAESDAPESADRTEADADDDSEPVDVIKGIGPAYADRLTEAGVETVADLAAADAADLEDETDISETRIQGWIDRAEVR